jgi:hypothetical protein
MVESEEVNGRMKARSTVVIAIVLSTLLLSVYFYDTRAYSQTPDSQTVEAKLTALEEENRLLRIANETAYQKLAYLNGTLDRYVLRYPTFEELKQFLKDDKTNQHARIKGQYECMDFARDLKIHAAAAGWNVSFVVANFYMTWNGEKKGIGHAFNGVLLANNTMVWVEPQNDHIYTTIDELLVRLYLFPVQVSIIEVVVVW